jgi:UDP-2-acetamido-2-deoxy-ribo-hexuluronate aminotransferase
MRPIQMVDTRNQYEKIKPAVDAAIAGVLDSSAFINGQPVRDFMSHLCAYLDTKHSIPCANGTDALQIAMMALGLEPGDEVITPSFTYIATTEVIALLRLKPVFAEVDEKTFCIDPTKLEEKITSRTKAIVPVHLYGHAAHMEPIMQLAEKYKLAIIEDNAQAIGCNYIFRDGVKKKTGTIGHIGTTSFYPSKNLGAFGDGGAIFTDDEKLASLMQMIANHGQTKRYYHDIVGCNSRLDTIQAAILDIKLARLDEYISARRKAAAWYNQAFAGHDQIRTPYCAEYSEHAYHQYTIVLEGVDRDGLHTFLSENKVPSMIYYPVPGHRQRMFEHFTDKQPELKITDWLTERVISLPMHTELDESQLEYISGKVLEYVNKSGK